MDEARKPNGDAELREWLENMVWYHHFSDEEIAAATGYALEDIQRFRAQFDIHVNNRPRRPEGSPLLVLPYPGGRHPRIQFLEGAVRPQRETKFSVFAPWDETAYAVVDLPEAIWSNLGLTYLAHTHVPTLWTKQNVTLERREWQRGEGGRLSGERTLPNGIRFAARVHPGRDAVRMELELTNGTPEPLTDLRVQICVMLKGLTQFEQLTNDNKVFETPYIACRDATGKRWILTAWEPCHRTWANPPCPCLHSDPRFPDCGPGETRKLRGWLSFYEGTEIRSEIQRVEQLGWRK
ncbi:MAG: hypothetical protein FJX77_00410 [Armatimonadetes bacterium]|nr:hypothetical protein [Armatimonadota bacterium]